MTFLGFPRVIHLKINKYNTRIIASLLQKRTTKSTEYTKWTIDRNEPALTMQSTIFRMRVTQVLFTHIPSPLSIIIVRPLFYGSRIKGRTKGENKRPFVASSTRTRFTGNCLWKAMDTARLSSFCTINTLRIIWPFIGLLKLI